MIPLHLVRKDLVTKKMKKNISTNIFSPNHIPEECITQEICDDIVKLEPRRYRMIPEQFRTKELSMYVVSVDGLLLNYVPMKHRSYELCEKAVTQNGLALKWTPKKYLQDNKLAAIAINQNTYAIRYCQHKNYDMWDIVFKYPLGACSVGVDKIPFWFKKMAMLKSGTIVDRDLESNRLNTIIFINPKILCGLNYFHDNSELKMIIKRDEQDGFKWFRKHYYSMTREQVVKYYLYNCDVSLKKPKEEARGSFAKFFPCKKTIPDIENGTLYDYYNNLTTRPFLLSNQKNHCKFKNDKPFIYYRWLNRDDFDMNIPYKNIFLALLNKNSWGNKIKKQLKDIHIIFT